MQKKEEEKKGTLNRAKVAIRNMLLKGMNKELISEILEVSIELVEEVYKEEQARLS